MDNYWRICTFYDPIFSKYINFSIITTADEGESTKKPEDNLYDSIIVHEKPPNLKRQQENHQNALL